jgi:hypothetical protein
MKAVTDTLGVARSNIAARVSNVRRPRGPQTRDRDLEPAAELQRLVDARPTLTGGARPSSGASDALPACHSSTLSESTG